ncbi:hypothetical protein D3C80_1460250 [compost metagenome]
MLERWRQLKLFDIASYRIALLRKHRRTQMLMSVPRIHRVHILRFIVALQLDMSGNLNKIPSGAVMRRLIKINRTTVRMC